MLSLGILALPVGAVLLIAANRDPGFGLIDLGVSASLIAAGIPMIVVGGHRLTPEEQEDRDRESAAHWWVPTQLGITPRSVSMGWRF